MFLRGLGKAWVDRQGSQHSQGAFLILMSPANLDVLGGQKRRLPHRGLVRFVRLSQSGHFMVGSVKVRSQSGTLHTIPLSGAYGADGLIREVPNEIYSIGTDLPEELREKWNEGGGHNSAGSEASAMDAWAKTLKWPASTYGADRKKKRQ